MSSRADGRSPRDLRPLSCQWDIAGNAAGSALLRCGKTEVICTATVEESVPRWMKDKNVSGGWLTAEYSMLPASTHDRKPRDSARGKVDGRSTEIQRLLGRSLRAVTDLEALGPRSLWIDCDVLSADGGTRTTAITGACLALRRAIERLQISGRLAGDPLRSPVAAISVGLLKGAAILDLDYPEDRDAEVDMNVVMTGTGRLVEVQAGGEEHDFTRQEFDQLLGLAEEGIRKVLSFQESAWKSRPAAVPLAPKPA
ncbi:MAG: ribonuclease PH [Candidatus Methylacidiphilales bacterium]|jgi:ribonuclease PH